jgi:hypothetical protein
VLMTVFDSRQVEAAKQGKPHRLPLVNDILRRMDPLEEVRNPVSFYSKFVKVFIRNKDAYRTYYPRYMWAVTVVQRTSAAGPVYNPKPMFGPRTPTKQAPPEGVLRKAARAKAQTSGGQQQQKGPPVQKQNRLELIKARQAALKKAPRPR